MDQGIFGGLVVKEGPSEFGTVEGVWTFGDAMIGTITRLFREKGLAKGDINMLESSYILPDMYGMPGIINRTDEDLESPY